MRVIGAVCAIFLAVTAWGEEATWPTYAELTKTVKAGDYLTYKQTMKRNGTASAMTVWHTWTEMDGALKLTAIALRQDLEEPREPTTETSAQVMRMTPPIKPEEPFQKSTPPPGATVTRDSTEQAAFTGLDVGGRKWDGTVYTQKMSLALPNEMTLLIQTRMWVSPGAPATGVIKLQQIVTGAMDMDSTMELVWSSTHRDVAPEAPAATTEPATAPTAAVVTDGKDLLAYSVEMARRFWKADASWKSTYTGVEQDIDSYRMAYIRTLIQRDQLDDAIKAEAEFPEKSPLLYHLRRELITAVAVDGRPLQVMLRWGVLEKNLERDATHAKITYMAENPTLYEFAFLLKTVREIPDPIHRRSAVHVVMSARNDSATVEQKKAMLALLPDDNERMNYAKGRLWSLTQNTPDVAAMDELCVLVPALTQEPDFAGQRLTVLMKAGEIDTLKAELDAYLASPDMDPSIAYTVLTACADPRASDIRTAAQQRTFETKAKQVHQAAQHGYLRAESVEDLASAAAAMGNRELATKAITTYLRAPISRNWIAPIVSLYGIGGKPQEALAWRDSLPLGEREQAADQPFWRLAALAEIDAGIAEWEFTQGNQEAFQRYMTQAIEGALAANKALIAYNKGKDRKDLVWWHRLGAVDSATPYAVVVATLIRLKQYPPAIKVLREVQDEMPTTDGAREVWETTIKTLAEEENWAMLAAVASLLPKDWEVNWYTALISDTARRLANANQVEALQALAETIETPNWRAEVQRAAVIGLANQGEVTHAAAIFAELKASVEAGASSTHQAFAAVALARAQLKASQQDAALATWQDRTGNLSEGMIKRGFNGVDWKGYMMELGADIHVAGMPPADRLKWFDTCRTDAERAYLALGMTKIMP